MSHKAMELSCLDMEFTFCNHKYGAINAKEKFDWDPLAGANGL
jgi:hypothetical protein